MDIISINKAIISSDVQYGPARIEVSGKTATDKKLSAVEQSGLAARMFLSNAKGKVGKAAREGQSAGGLSMMVACAIKNNYKDLACALAGITGESVVIGSRARFASMPDEYTAKLLDLRNGGYTTDKKTGVEKKTAKRVAYEQCLALCNHVIAKVEEHYAEVKRLKDEATQQSPAQ